MTTATTRASLKAPASGLVATATTLAGSTLIPGPIVVETVTDLM